MDRSTVLRLLSEHREQVRERFGARHLALFGSAARDELRENSDVDVLVEFEGPATFDRYMDLKFFLQTILGRPVDLVTRNAVKPRMLPMIEKDLIDVA